MIEFLFLLLNIQAVFNAEVSEHMREPVSTPYKSTEFMQNVLQIAYIRTILD